MSNSLLEAKIRHLETWRAMLLEDFEAVHEQLRRTMNAVDRNHLLTEIKSLEKRIQETEDDLKNCISLSQRALQVGQYFNNQYLVNEVYSKRRRIYNLENVTQIVRALDEPLAREVAIIPLTLDQKLSDELTHHLRTSFLLEANILTRLMHPNIVRFYTVISEPLAKVMEWVPGSPLQNLLDAGTQLTPDKVITIGIRLANAMKHIHEQGVIHLNIKPSKIILTKDRGPVIIDFSNARLKTHANDLPYDTGLVTAYTAPERILNPEAADNPADMFSLGTVLYELLSQQRPYVSNDPSYYQDGCLPEPNQFGISDCLYQILCSLLNENPGQRKTAVQLEIDLAKCLAL